MKEKKKGKEMGAFLRREEGIEEKVKEDKKEGISVSEAPSKKNMSAKRSEWLAGVGWGESSADCLVKL